VTVGPCCSAAGPTARASAGHVTSSSSHPLIWRGVVAGLAGSRTTCLDSKFFRQSRPEHVRRVRALLCSLAEPARARNATRAEHNAPSIRCSGANRQRHRRRPREDQRAPSMPRTTPLFAELINRPGQRPSSEPEGEAHEQKKKSEEIYRNTASSRLHQHTSIVQHNTTSLKV
jgi:hypothetical protein